MKIPFTLDAWLKDKSQRVETRDGCHVVEAISVDLTRDSMRVMANFGNNRIVHYYDDGRFWENANSDNDLFIITPEPELTSWQTFISGCLQKYGLLDCGAADRIAKECSAELLELARKELIEEPYTSDPRKTGLYKLGKAEALKDLPRWIDDGLPIGSAMVDISGLCRPDFIRRQGKLLRIPDLEKLPGFKED